MTDKPGSAKVTHHQRCRSGEGGAIVSVAWCDGLGVVQV